MGARYHKHLRLSSQFETFARMAARALLPYRLHVEHPAFFSRPERVFEGFHNRASKAFLDFWRYGIAEVYMTKVVFWGLGIMWMMVFYQNCQSVRHYQHTSDIIISK